MKKEKSREPCRPVLSFSPKAFFEKKKISFGGAEKEGLCLKSYANTRQKMNEAYFLLAAKEEKYEWNSTTLGKKKFLESLPRLPLSPSIHADMSDLPCRSPLAPPIFRRSAFVIAAIELAHDSRTVQCRLWSRYTHCEVCLLLQV